MQIGIIGVGAMSSLFAARLSSSANIMMVGHWPEQLATIKEDGLTLVHPDGQESRHEVPVTNNPDDVAAVDAALVLVKSYQTPQAVKTAESILATGGLALTLQNGLGNLEQLSAVLGPTRTTLGTTTEGATMLGPGRVRHAAHGITHLATTAETADRITQLAALFRQTGFEIDVVDHDAGNIESLVWGKLAVSAAINPLTALLRVPNGFLADDRSARAVMAVAANEVAAVARAQGIGLPYPDAAQRALEVATATAQNRSSMLQDVERGAPTEIDAICGAVVRAGERHNVPAPLNSQLLQLIRQIESGEWRVEIDRPLDANLQSLISNL